MKRPTVIGITLGDINGIGPEVALRAAHRRWPAGTRLVLIGSVAAIHREARLLGYDSPPAWQPGDTGSPPRKITCWDPTPTLAPSYRPGRIVPSASRAAHAWISHAVKACREKQLDAMVTAPITKEGFARAGYKAPGHTELLAELTGTRRFAMMLFGGPLRVVLVTRHVPLRDVARFVTRASVREAICLTHEALPWLGFPRGRIAVCGLNPHAGDGGHIGREDLDVIRPVVRDLGKKGLHLTGPVPSDTVFFQARRGDFDAVVAMYHDQGLGPLKMLAFDEGVNVTLGLPIVRTSPDHGTAFDIAGRQSANPASMVEAVRSARLLALQPNPWAREKRAR